MNVPIHRRDFDNGLSLVWEEDHRQPMVAIEVRIKGGLRAEGPYLGSGITHFMEHMLFKGTPTRPPGSIDQEVRRYGGSINAYTSFDTTGVTLYVGSQYLPQALELVADVLRRSQFPEAEFEKEREVILSELRMNKDDPGRRLQRLFWSRHFLEHPYRHPILGYEDLLKALTVEDLREYYRRQYHPDNIVLSVVGDFEPDGLQEAVEAQFGDWPREIEDPLQRFQSLEPPVIAAKDAVEFMPVDTAYVLLGFRSTRLASPDLYALDVLATILGQGESSRLHRGLVREKGAAETVTAWNYTPYDPGVFGIRLRTSVDRVDAAVAAALEEIRLLRERGVSEEELAKAKRQTRAGYLFGLQTIAARAGDIASSMEATGDPAFTRAYVDRIQEVTAEEVLRVAAEYLDPGFVTTAKILPQSAEEAVTRGKTPGEGLTVVKSRLPNGLTVLLGKDESLPLVSMVVAFRGGLRVENEETQGISSIVAEMLTKGTKELSAEEIASTVESLGGNLASFSGYDGLGLELSLLAEDAATGVDLLRDLVTGATFPEEELAIQKRLALQRLQAERDDIFQVAGNLMREVFYGAHPYHLNPTGSEESLERLGSDDCARYRNAWLNPGNAVLAVYGDIDPEALARRIEKAFGKWRGDAVNWPARLEEPSREEPALLAQTMDRQQSVIILGYPGTRRDDPDRFPLQVLGSTLSGMAGRLFQSVREEHGLAYTLGAAHRPAWDGGHFAIYAATRPGESDRVVELLVAELDRVAESGLSSEELEEVKRRIIGAHRMELQSLSSVTRMAVLDELFGLGYDAWREFDAQIQAVDAAAVQEAAREYLRPEDSVRVLVGPEAGQEQP